ncbi:hypothetical protein ES288_A11G275000v1 [Gossypium darwinii]|uniref:Large ribosomal subunit protein eL20 domain-containing protein n=1 Tax=Gossypium darwinii TaxID=34276 RepID=A0A5D2ER08_GOSDA|nr:hypothetical protein ES288_A11G275000v1 [Gossypium darwinii]
MIIPFLFAGSWLKGRNLNDLRIPKLKFLEKRDTENNLEIETDRFQKSLIFVLFVVDKKNDKNKILGVWFGTWEPQPKTPILKSRDMFKLDRLPKEYFASHGRSSAANKQIFEKNPTKIKNYGKWLRYQSRTSYQNMYKEYHDTTLNGAVEQVRFLCIKIIKTTTIPAKLCKRDSTK